MQASQQEGFKPKPLHEYPAVSASGSLFSHYGFESSCATAISCIDGNTILAAAGKYVLFINVASGEVTSQEGPHDGAIGAVAVHPARKHYAVGERTPSSPLVRVYEWPSRTCSFSFDGGAEVGYAAISFSKEGDRMATVAASPDYTLAVWDWATQSLLLRSKCFSSDVYNVAFSAFDSSVLVSGGSGHIKFWSMAQTFTGKKLQGSLGKFGRLETSDMDAFAVLPDRKVFSGAQDGSILLWEGDLVRCRFVRDVDGSVPCHDGAIHHVSLYGEYLVTSGEDGYMRYWRRSELETAEGEGVPPCYAAQCVHEVLVKERFPIRSVSMDEALHQWILCSRYGVIATVPAPTLTEGGEISDPLQEPGSAEATAKSWIQLNGSCVACSAVSPVDDTVFTGGADGALRQVNFVRGEEVNQIPPLFDGKGQPISVTALKLLPDVAGRSQSSFSLVAGYADGTLRHIRVGEELSVVEQWKPHEGAIMEIAVDPQGLALCSVSDADATVFFFRIGYSGADGTPAIVPLGFCKAPLLSPTCAAWDALATHGIGGCLLGYENGTLLSIASPEAGEVAGEEGSFEFACAYDLVAIRQQKLPPPRNEDDADALTAAQEEELNAAALEEKDEGPWAIRTLSALPGVGVAVGMDQKELAYIYQTAVRYTNTLTLPPLPATGVEPPNYVEEPALNVVHRDAVPQKSFASSDGSLIVACAGAQLFLRLGSDMDTPILLPAPIDSTKGLITGAYLSRDASMVVTTGTDGVVSAILLPSAYAVPVQAPQIQHLAPQHVAASSSADAQDIAAALSLEQQREAERQALAEETEEAARREFVERLEAIHRDYEALVEQNCGLGDEERLSSEELVLDPALANTLHAEMKRRTHEAEKRFLLDTARSDLATKKLRAYFLDNMQYDHFALHAFHSTVSVSSFRVLDPAKSLERLEVAKQQLVDTDSEEDSDLEDGKEHPADRAAAAAALAKAAEQEMLLAAALKAKKEAERIPLSLGASISVQRQINKTEARRAERQERREGYASLLSRKPDASVDDAECAAELQRLRDCRGECILRTADAYRGAWEFRPTASAKLERLGAMQVFMAGKQSVFNEKLLKLREFKKTVIERCNTWHERIAAIEQTLRGAPAAAIVDSLTEEEEPERLFSLSREMLEEYRVQKAAAAAAAEELRKAQRGFGADLAGKKVSGPERSSSTHLRNRSRTSHQNSYVERGSRQSTITGFVHRERMDAELRSKLENIKPSAMEEEEAVMERNQLTAELQQLERRVRSLQRDFDEQLEALRRERANLDADMCLAHSRLLLLFREYEALLVYRAEDKRIKRDMRSMRKKRRTLQGDVAAVQERIAEAEKQLRGLKQKIGSYNQSAEGFIDEECSGEAAHYLKRIYHRVLKRHKQTENNDDDDDITSDDEDDELEDDIGEEVCPVGCSQETWDEVRSRREVRLDLTEESANTEAKLAKARAALAKNESHITEVKNSLEKSVEELEKLELVKRRELNQLLVLVPLHLSQVKAVDGEGQQSAPSRAPLPAWSEAPVVVLGNDSMEHLKSRIHTLAQNKVDYRASLAGMVEELHTLKDEQEKARRVHTEWEDKVYEVMMLKCGQRVDLELLEACGTTRRIEAKKEELRQTELQWERKVRRNQGEIQDLRRRLQEKLYDNTSLLQHLGDLESTRQEIETTLTKATTKSLQHPAGSRIATRQQRGHLQDLIVAQQEEIDALNAEITMLRRKGGHAYAARTL